MLPADQIRYALNCPVPKTFPPLNDPRVSAVLFGGSAMRILSEEEEKTYYSAFHPQRLEFAGDRLWHSIIVEVLFVLAPIQPLVPPGEPFLSGYNYEFSRLSRNEMAAELAKRVHLNFGMQDSISKRKDIADRFEAFLFALYTVNGRRALLEFLVPLIRHEYLTPRLNTLPPTTTIANSTMKPEAHQIVPPAPLSSSVALAKRDGKASSESSVVCTASSSSSQDPLAGVPDYSLKSSVLKRMTECKFAPVHLVDDENGNLVELLRILSTQNIPFLCRTDDGSCVLAVAGQMPIVVSLSKRKRKRSDRFYAERTLGAAVTARGLIVQKPQLALVPVTASPTISSPTAAQSETSTSSPSPTSAPSETSINPPASPLASSPTTSQPRDQRHLQQALRLTPSKIRRARPLLQALSSPST